MQVVMPQGISKSDEYVIEICNLIDSEGVADEAGIDK
jgi:hypothetical protein